MNENLHDRMHPHKIDELFRAAIDASEQPPAPEVWDGVEKKLDQYHLVNIKRKYNNLKSIAIGLVLLLLSSFLYELQTRHAIVENANNGIKHSTNPDLRNGLSEIAKGNRRDISKTSNSAPGQSLTDQSLSGSKIPVVATPSRQETLLTDRANKLPNPIGEPFNKSRFNGNEPEQFMHSQANGNDNGEGLSQKNTTITGYKPAYQRDNNLAAAFPSAIDLLSSRERYLNRSADFIKFPNPDLLPAIHLNQVVSSGSSAQSNQAIILGKRKSRFSFTLIFSPDFTSRIVKSDWAINREDNKDDIIKSERYAFSYSLGVLADYSMNAHWGVQSGFTISKAVMDIQPKFIFARPDNLGEMKYKFNSSDGYSFISSKTFTRPAYGDSLHAMKSSSSLQYLSFPVTVKYKFGRKKLNFNALAGVSANILLKDKVQTSLYPPGTNEFAVDSDIRGLKPVYYSALLAAGVSYNIIKTLAVSITPTARVALTSINKDAPVKSYQESLGLVAGVTLNF